MGEEWQFDESREVKSFARMDENSHKSGLGRKEMTLLSYMDVRALIYLTASVSLTFTRQMAYYLPPLFEIPYSLSRKGTAQYSHCSLPGGSILPATSAREDNSNWGLNSREVLRIAVEDSGLRLESSYILPLPEIPLFVLPVDPMALTAPTQILPTEYCFVHRAGVNCRSGGQRVFIGQVRMSCIRRERTFGWLVVVRRRRLFWVRSRLRFIGYELMCFSMYETGR